MRTPFTSFLLGLAVLSLGGLGACQHSGPAPAPFASDVEFVPLPGANLFPEGIVATRRGEFFVGGFGNGALLRVGPQQPATYFKQPGQDGLSSAVGLAVDETRDRLWVANFNLQTGQSNLKVFDVNTGALLATLTPPNDGKFHFFNEVALDKTGRAYVSDTGSPIIWTADVNLTRVEEFVNDPLLDNPEPDQPFSLNGLAFSPNERYLIASVMDRIDPGGGRLVRVDMATRAVSDVRLTGAAQAIATFGGSDGMFFERNLLLMVNVTPPSFIMTARFNADYSSAELVARPAYDQVYNRATSSAVLQGRLWTVNSQLDHIIDDQNGALNTPPDLPFELVSVPLRNVLGQ